MNFKFQISDSRSSFTLIEMITVTAIIAVLVGLLLPAYQYAKNQAKKHICRQDMSNLKSALMSFRAEYGYFPQPANWTDLGTMLNGNFHPYTGTGAAAGSFSSNNNPRAIRFMEFKTNSVDSTGALVDPWQKAYIVLMDNGTNSVGKVIGSWTDTTPEDGQVDKPGGGTSIQSQVAIYSSGSNMTDDNGDTSSYDDVISWSE